ncbi:MAG: DUF4468 domain-containing protein [Bacteroidota bacterium]|nr:DUF4468 domain-containing protein [Bacteroidota bacterium]
MSFFFLPFTLFAQVLPRDKSSGKIYYSEEVLVKDGPQQDLYHRAKAWFASPGKTTKTLRVDDHVNSILVGEIGSQLSLMEGNLNQKFQLWYTLHLQLADDRYWLSLEDFQLQKQEKTQKPSSIKSSPLIKQPLEAWLNPKAGVNSKGKNQNQNQLIEKAIQKSILTQMEDLREHLL